MADWAGIFSYLRTRYGGVICLREEAVNEDEQNCAADGDVEPVALAGEAGDAEDDAEHGSGDEEEDSELDDAGGVQVRVAPWRTSERLRIGLGESGSSQGLRRWGFARERMPPSEDDRRGEGDSPAEHVGDGGVELFVGEGLHLDFPGEAAVDHLEAECDDDDAEEDFESVNAGLQEDACADEGSGEDAEHDRHGDSGIDVPAMEIDAGAGCGGDSDHEVAGGGGDLEGEFHDLIHGEDFDGSGADAEQA